MLVINLGDRTHGIRCDDNDLYIYSISSVEVSCGNKDNRMTITNTILHIHFSNEDSKRVFIDEISQLLATK